MRHFFKLLRKFGLIVVLILAASAVIAGSITAGVAADGLWLGICVGGLTFLLTAWIALAGIFALAGTADTHE